MTTMEKIFILLMAAFVVGLGSVAYVNLFDETSGPQGETLPPRTITPPHLRGHDASEPTERGPVADGTDQSRRRRAIESEGSSPDPNEDQSRPAPPANAGSIRGRVVDPDGNGLGHALVDLQIGSGMAVTLRSSRRSIGVSVRTDGEGEFVIPGVAPGENYVLEVEHDSFAGTEMGPLDVTPSDETYVGSIFMRMGHAVYGRVVDVNGRAISGATLAINDQYVSAFLPEDQRRPWKVLKSDAKGHYRFNNVGFPNFELVVNADGYETKISNNGAFLKRGKDKEINFELGPESAIHGIVSTEDGHGVEGARVVANLINSKHSSRGETLTDSRGRFEIRGLVAGHYMTRVQKEGFSDDMQQRVMSGTDNLRITLLPRGGIEGRVVDKGTQAPVPDFTVIVKKFREGRPLNHTGINKSFGSPRGEFALLDLDPDTYLLAVAAKGYAVGQSRPMDVHRSRRVQDVVIGLDQGGSIKGRLVDRNGEPIADARVRLNANKFRTNPLVEIFKGVNYDPSKPELTATSDFEGEFEIDLVVEGTYQIAVDHPDYSKLAMNDIVVQTSRETDIGPVRLSNGGALTGRALDEQGRPLAGATINASTRRGFLKTSRTDREGRFDIENLPPGKYYVSIAEWTQSTGEEPVHPLMRLVYTKNSSQEIFVEDGRETECSLRLSRGQ